ncbi:MAG: AAA family ATPase, partial [Oscillospiraceae bacterium]|nr:AAA family ATPase [Oscillospiraceae bacterium]
MTGHSTVEGTVQNVVFRNEENGYTVLALVTDLGEEVTVVGCIPFAAAGESMTITGTWVEHATYGVQLAAETVDRRMPKDEEEILVYLSSGVLKGVGPATAARLVERFGADTLRVIEEEPERLTAIKGMTAKKATEISTAFRALTGLRRVTEFLSRYELPVSMAMSLVRAYGENTLSSLKDNPYLLADDRFGVEFSTADEIAISMGFGGDDVCRVEAAVLYELSHNLGNGHVFLPRNKLVAATAQLIDVDGDTVEKAVDDLCEGGKTICRPIANVQGCYLRRMYEAETYVAKRLWAACTEECEHWVDAGKIIGEIEMQQGVVYAPLQRHAVTLAAEKGVLVLTGGPGTGKTLIQKAILDIYRRKNPGKEICCCAPTGRAARRMEESTGFSSSTVHKALGLMAGEDDEYDGLEMLDADLILADETSMLDIYLAANLFRAVNAGSQVILVGDAEQLPSVGPGAVLREIIASNCIPVVRLDKVFRQNKGSRIAINAKLIRHGNLSLEYGTDFQFVDSA